MDVTKIEVLANPHELALNKHVQDWTCGLRAYWVLSAQALLAGDFSTARAQRTNARAAENQANGLLVAIFGSNGSEPPYQVLQLGKTINASV